MKFNHLHLRLFAVACTLAMITVSGVVGAQAVESRPADTPKASGAEASALAQINDAVGVVQRMLQESRMRELLQQAKGIFIVPRYGRAALGVGASGGTGVLLMKRADGSWSDPAFYNIGGISAGAQVGAEAGAIALVLNNEKAVNKFLQKNAFALSAESGVTVVNWSRIAQGALGDGDVVAWTGTKGLYANLVAVGVSDIRYNENLTKGYYRQQTVTPADVLAGRMPPSQAAEPLKQALGPPAAAAPR